MESAAVIRGHELPKMNDSELGGLFRSCWGGRLEDRAWPTSPGGHRECSPPGTPEEPGCGHWRQRRLPAWPYWFMGGGERVYGWRTARLPITKPLRQTEELAVRGPDPVWEAS